MTELPVVINYAIRFPGELRSRSEKERKLSGFIFNWATNFKLSNEFAAGPRNSEENDGGSPPGYINVIENF